MGPVLMQRTHLKCESFTTSDGPCTLTVVHTPFTFLQNSLHPLLSVGCRGQNSFTLEDKCPRSAGWGPSSSPSLRRRHRRGGAPAPSLRGDLWLLNPKQSQQIDSMLSSVVNQDGGFGARYLGRGRHFGDVFKNCRVFEHPRYFR